MIGHAAILLAVLSFSAPASRANEPEEGLPREVKNLTQEVLGIRSLAFQEAPVNMRSEAGVHGRAVEALLDQIAEKISDDPSLVETVHVKTRTSIKMSLIVAKIRANFASERNPKHAAIPQSHCR